MPLNATGLRPPHSSGATHACALNPMEAVVGAISIGVDFVQKMFVADVLIVLFAGGILSGLLAEWAARRWR